MIVLCVFFLSKQKTAYEMRISDWSSDVCSSDLMAVRARQRVLRSQPRGQRGIRRARGGVLEPRRRADEGAYREVVDRVVAAREHAQAPAAGAFRELGHGVHVGLRLAESAGGKRCVGRV